MDAPEPVSAKVERVETRFSEVKLALGTNSSNVRPHLAHRIRQTVDLLQIGLVPEEVGDVYDRFLLWAGNIGARNTPESKFSLESRLAAAGELLDQVLDLLNDLNDALEDLLEIAVGNQENRTIHADFGTSETERPDERDEAHDILGVASECIRSLLRISILIRKATPRDRFAKATATAFSRGSPFLDQFDINYVAERYPKLRGNGTLCDRLGRAITKRRQFFRYSRQHRARTAGDADQPQGVEEEQTTDAILAQNAFLVSHNDKGKSIYSPAMSKMGSVSEGAHTRPSTKASTLDVARLARLDLGERLDDERSYVSASSSFQITGGGEGALRLPTLAEVCKGEAMFECPFCYGIQTISKELDWRRHAFHDLRAYVCTLGGAECENCFFGDSRAWFDHEMQHHRRTWVCVLCQEGPFKSLDKMESHAVSKHSDILVQQSQISVLVDAGQRSLDAIPARDCPFCDEWAESLEANTPAPEGRKVVITVDPTLFRRHLSFHQEQLALFAIPRTSHIDIHEDVDGSAGGDLLSHTQGLHPERDAHGDTEVQTWVPDPPLLVAAASGSLSEVELLLAGGADPAANGESWGDLWEAARSFQGSTPRETAEYVEAVSRLAERYRRAKWGDVFPRVFPRAALLGAGLGALGADEGTQDNNRDSEPAESSAPLRQEKYVKRKPVAPRRRISTTTNDARRRPSSFHEFGDHVDTYRYTGPESLARYDLKYPGKLKLDRELRHGPLMNWNAPESWATKGVGDTSSQPDDLDRSRPSNFIPGEDESESLFAPRRQRISFDDRDEVMAGSDNEQQRSRIAFSLPADKGADSDKPPESPKGKGPAVKGILKQPTPNFPEEVDAGREGIAPHKSDNAKGEVPAWARWTKISRKMVNPEALTIGKERFEVKDDFVIVLRVLTKEEIQAYADSTATLRERRRTEASKKTVDEWMVGRTAEAAEAASTSMSGAPATTQGTAE
ncbi:hypothetical protein QBC34DRAFT_29307 [Podospora aff. communis PSN243]|uniref:C2H2-type domain-containing protein n=1 Tax=Podospora aff. communis PSN243 TaxID=3040156 RepID=A0AAV9H1K4_9PEZI|nr:hypothetical protein QBC34DRAFT_29307 [Podospora aff. communis PSN243]